MDQTLPPAGPVLVGRGWCDLSLGSRTQPFPTSLNVLSIGICRKSHKISSSSVTSRQWRDCPCRRTIGNRISKKTVQNFKRGKSWTEAGNTTKRYKKETSGESSVRQQNNGGRAAKRRLTTKVKRVKDIFQVDQHSSLTPHQHFFEHCACLYKKVMRGLRSAKRMVVECLPPQTPNLRCGQNGNHRRIRGPKRQSHMSRGNIFPLVFFLYNPGYKWCVCGRCF